MKKKYALLGATAAVVATAVIGGSLAAWTANTESQDSEMGISLKSLGAVISLDAEQDNVYPGGEWITKEAVVTNDVDGGYDIYVKVTVSKDWFDEEDASYVELTENSDSAQAAEAAGTSLTTMYVGGKAVADEKDTVYGSKETADKLQVGEVIDGWIVGEVYDDQVVLYYTEPLEYGESTTKFLDKVAFSKLLDNDYIDKAYSVEVEIEAVQKNNAIDSIPAEFGVEVEIEDDKIVKILD